MRGVKKHRCAYCNRKAVSKDHVPATNLFGSRQDSWVPSCFACNNGSAHDDAMFREMLCIRVCEGSVGQAKEANDAVLRDWQRAESKRHVEELFNSIFFVKTEAGISAAIPFDRELAYKVVRRHVRGLYWLYHKKSLPSYRLMVVSPEVQMLEAEEKCYNVMKKMIGQSQPMFVKSQEYFCYWRVKRRDLEVWCLRYYGEIYFLGLCYSQQAKVQMWL